MRNIPTVYRVPCPVCDALPGERCMFPGGQIKKWAHEQRETNAFQNEKNEDMTDAAYMEAEHIRDLTQQYADNHPGISEEEARRRVLELEGKNK